MTRFDYLNLKFQFIWAILAFMSSSDFMLSCVEHEKSFITSGPDKPPLGDLPRNSAARRAYHPDMTFAALWKLLIDYLEISFNYILNIYLGTEFYFYKYLPCLS